MTPNFDLVIIGSGPGGYVAAIRAAQLKMKVAIIEKYSTLGGTCLNVGCIPSKALLDSSEKFYELTHHFKDHGINAENPKFDFTKMIERKNKVVSQTCDGITFLMKKNKIQVITGTASFHTTNSIIVTDKNGSVSEVSFSKAIIASGSVPSNLPKVPLEIDKKRIITSTQALSLKEVPKHLIVVGGGVIGIELGSVYSRLGAKVSVVEYMDRIIPAMDAQLSQELKKILSKQGMEFYLGHQVTSIINRGEDCLLKAQFNGKEVELTGDIVLISVGRRANVEDLKLDKIGIQLSPRGYIETNDHLETNIKNIYAIGDCTKGVMLAHKAEEEGVYVVERMNNQLPHINYQLIPSVVYTWPEFASVGKNEEELKKSEIPYKKGIFPFKALGRARASEDTEGLVKILSHEKTDEILGMHILGARAADLIANCVTAMEYRASSEDIARMCHAHPTFAEAIKEAALDALEKRPIHL